MKRLLLATTALCMGAGVAMAMEESVSDGMGMAHGMDMMDGMGMAPTLGFSGFAEMGVAGNKDDEARLHTDIDVTFKATGTMDSGVTWSADVDLDEVRNEIVDGAPVKDHATANDDEDGGVTISIGQPEGFGTLTMGDTAGAIAWAVSDARGAGPGSIRDNHEHKGSSGNDGLDAKHDNQVLRWDRVIGSGFSLAASVEIDDEANGEPGGTNHDPILGIGGKYEMGMGVGTLGLGAGFQTGTFKQSFTKFGMPKETHWMGEVDATAFGGSVSVDFGNGSDGVKVIADGGLMEADGGMTKDSVTSAADFEAMHVGLGLGYTVGAISLGVNVGNSVTESTHDPNVASASDKDAVGLETTVNGIGFSAAYELGGGAAIRFGAGSHEAEHDWSYEGDATASGCGEDGHDRSSDTNSWSLGVKFSF